jgi:hypothetical protein
MMSAGFLSVLTGYFLYVAAGFLIVPFLVVYILEDLGGRRSRNRDGFLGPKVWLSFLMSVSGQVVLAGVAFLLALTLDESLFRSDGEPMMWKTAWGLVVGGSLASICPIVILLFRVPRRGPVAVYLKALGINGFLTGMVFTIALVVTVVLLFQGADSGNGTAAAIALAYAIATVILGGALTGRSVREYSVKEYSGETSREDEEERADG